MRILYATFKGTEYITEIKKGITGSREFAEPASSYQSSWEIFINCSFVACNQTVNFSYGFKIFFSDFLGVIRGWGEGHSAELCLCSVRTGLTCLLSLGMHIAERSHFLNILQLHRSSQEYICVCVLYLSIYIHIYIHMHVDL